MIQKLEATLKAGGVPMAPQFNPASTNVPRSSSSVSNSSRTQDHVKPKPEVDHAKPVEKTTPAELQTSNTNGIADPLGDARSKVQEEIGREFAAIMATGTLRASEAAALATKRVMQKYGHATLSQG